MHRLYAVQQRLAITSAEASALLFVSAVLLLGLGVRHLQSQSVAFEADYYTELNEAFAERTESLRASASPPPEKENAEAQVQAVPVATEARPVSRRAAASEPVRMNLNTASEQTLQRLPGVGPAIAARIADYRNAYGGFREPREVMRVKGIGPKTFEKMAPYLFVTAPEEE
jgi:competence protein ComEA